MLYNFAVSNSLLAAGFFSKGHYDQRLVIANANGVGREEKKAKQDGMTEWGRRRDEKKPVFLLVRAAPMSRPILL